MPADGHGRAMWLLHAAVVDVREGRILHDRAVRIVDGRIATLRDDLPDAAELGDEPRLDLTGRYVTPGLISVHTHLSVVYPFSATDEGEDSGSTVLRALARASDALAAGVTTVRCVHEINRADLVLRAAAAQGWARVPRIVGAGRAISTTGGHGHGMACVHADGFDGFLAAARAELAAGADHVKIFITGGIAGDTESFLGAQMTGDEMRAAVRAARDHQTYVVAHAGDGVAITEALDAGVTSFEHAYSLDDAVAAEMARRGAFLTPTLCVTRCPEWMADHAFTTNQIRRATSVGPTHLDSIRRAIDAGVQIVAGTDYPPGEPMDDTVVAVREMEFLADAGLGPAGALRAGTLTAARLLGREHRIGEIVVGAAADLLVLAGDPLVDLGALHDPLLVVQGGHIVRDQLGRRPSGGAVDERARAVVGP